MDRRDSFLSRFHLRQPETAAHAALANWSEAVEVRLGGGRLLFVSGVVPDERSVRAAPPGTPRAMREQTRSVLTELRGVLERHGYDLSDLVKITCFLVAGDGGELHLEAFGEAYNEFITADALPARSRVAVARLVEPAWRVEIEAVAARSDRGAS